MVERDQAGARLSELETKAAEAVVLEAQEITPLRVQFEEVRAKWAEVHNVILVASDREAASLKD